MKRIILYNATKPYLYVLATFVLSVLIATTYSSTSSTDRNNQAIILLNQKQYSKSAALLKEAYSSDPTNSTIRNNYSAALHQQGVALANNGDLDSAITLTKASFSFNPSYYTAQIQKDLHQFLITRAARFLSNRQYAKAETDYCDAIGFFNNSYLAYCGLGDCFYDQHKLADAKKAWSKALQLHPNDKSILARLAKIGNEMAAESNFSEIKAEIFDIRFDSKTVSNDIYKIRENLMECYRDVGQMFNYFPDYKVIVLLYKDREFRDVLNVPHYIGGFYDGKIRVPVDFNRYPINELQAILKHEYCHAVISGITGNRCPRWIHEGLATSIMGRNSEPLVKKAVSLNRAIPLSLLEQENCWRDERLLHLAYAQSESIIRFMNNKWGMQLIRELLLSMKQGRTFESFVVSKMNRSRNQFEQEWIQSLQN